MTKPSQDAPTMPEVLTVEQAAAVLQLNPQTVMGLLRSGKLVGQKIGKPWRIHRDAVRDFLLGRKPPGIEDSAAEGNRRTG